MRRLYLRDSAPGDVVEDVYVITNKQLSATSTGKYFIKAFISDRTGQVTARMWNATRQQFDAMPESDFLRVRGRFENYQNNLQFIIEQTWPAKEGSFEVADLMPHTTKDVDQMSKRLHEICRGIKNRHVAALLQAYLDDEALMKNFCRAPAASSFHHAFLGGLLEHTLNAMEVAGVVCSFYPGLSADLVLAGIFLHDIAKTWELSYDSAFSYTDGGQLVGHVVKSAMWVEEKAAAASQKLGEPIPRAVIDVLQHIILSHHGQPEFGAARLPSTPEAIAVHMIENMDAKLMMALAVTREPAGAEGGADASRGNWTEYLKAFGGRLYRPDVAPGPQPAPAEQPPPPAVAPLAAAPASPPTPTPSAPAPQSGERAKPVFNNPLFETSPPRKK